MTATAGMAPSPENVETAAKIMLAFAERTGVASGRPPLRYLWTDAFAVCSFLGLAGNTADERYTELAVKLVDSVHRVLGRHREDDRRAGLLRAQRAEQGAYHPTLGGLRIGKKLPERGPHEPFDEKLEWERDGQYFHYLTKWMHALDQVARHTGEQYFNLWARELAKTAHDAFVHTLPFGNREKRMFWKMSIDLSRPLVPSMGHHDPLDGLVTALELRDTAERLPGAPPEPTLAHEMTSFAEMVDIRALATVDPLGIGGLLLDACRVAQLARRPDFESEGLLSSLLAAALQGVRHVDPRTMLDRPAESRLAFRELGLAIGLKGVEVIAESVRGTSHEQVLAALLAELQPYVALGSAISAFWLEAKHQRSESWSAHLDISEVMLAASLVPEGCLLLTMRGGH